MIYFITLILSYLIGNICGAIIITKLKNMNDIRKLGSGNPGTTNMTRTYGIKYGIATFLIDFSKGFLCPLIFYTLFNKFINIEYRFILRYIGGLGVILGHLFPIIFKFKGGKGFATGLGVLLFCCPVPTLIILLLSLIVLVLFDRMSICALFFFLLESIFYFINVADFGIVSCIIVFLYFILITYAHRKNIFRLINKQEPKLGLKKYIIKKK